MVFTYCIKCINSGCITATKRCDNIASETVSSKMFKSILFIIIVINVRPADGIDRVDHSLGDNPLKAQLAGFIAATSYLKGKESCMCYIAFKCGFH